MELQQQQQQQQQHEPHERMTVLEVARALRLQPSTVRAWILRKQLGYVKIGSRVFVPRSTVQQVISDGTVQAKPKVPRKRKARTPSGEQNAQKNR